MWALDAMLRSLASDLRAMRMHGSIISKEVVYPLRMDWRTLIVKK